MTKCRYLPDLNLAPLYSLTARWTTNMFLFTIPSYQKCYIYTTILILCWSIDCRSPKVLSDTLEPGRNNFVPRNLIFCSAPIVMQCWAPCDVRLYDNTTLTLTCSIVQRQHTFTIVPTMPQSNTSFHFFALIQHTTQKDTCLQNLIFGGSPT